MSVFIVVPSLKISGGIREALRLATEINFNASDASLITMWVSPNEMASPVPVKYLSSWPTRTRRALVEIPIIANRFVQWRRHSTKPGCSFIFTHYATLPLALLVPRCQRLFFVQGLEWTFVGNGLLSHVLKRFVLGTYRTGNVITANAYLSEQLAAEGIEGAMEAPIWADGRFLTTNALEQDIDFAMVLRKGAVKRLDLYLRFIELAHDSHMRVAVITPDDDIAAQVSDRVSQVLLRPELEQMRDLYARSVCFIHLSESEGFGLPPLESMGAGCTPVCRDSGGVRAFMRNEPFDKLLLPLSLPIEDVFKRAEAVVRDGNRLSRREAARACFKQGLARCEQARNGLVAAIVSRNQQ